MNLKNVQFCSSGTVTGVVKIMGKPYLLNLPPELLVFDVNDWISSKIHNYQAKINEAAESGTDTDYLEKVQQELNNWSADHSNNITSLPDVFHRIKFQHYVSKADLYSYFNRLRRFHTEKYHELKDAQFLLLTDDNTPKLYGTSYIAAALRHTGKEVLGERLSKEDLDNKISEILVADNQSFVAGKSRITPGTDRVRVKVITQTYQETYQEAYQET